MKIHNLIQGSPEWEQFRLDHYTASEAPAMLGLTNKTTRDELLRMKSTGNAKEYSSWVENVLFANGHKHEAMARPIVEKIIDDDLYPVTCSDGSYSASCDGLTLDGKIGFEHKDYNEQLAIAVENKDLPSEYMAQCQQILMVTGANKLVFVCSDGTETRRESMEIFPDSGWFQRIKDGWRQFEIDLKEYKPRDIPEKPEPDAIMQLPALTVQIKGEVTTSNLPEFKQAAETFIANIKTDLQTDEDFVNAESTVKFCAQTEKKIQLTKQAAIAQTASIDELMRTMDFISESIRVKRLALEKLVKTQKEEIKNKIIDRAYELTLDYIGDISSEIPLVKFRLIAEPIINKREFHQAAKNKRTLKSLHNAIDTHLANVKIALDNAANDVRFNLQTLKHAGHTSLFPDIQQLITKDAGDFQLLVNARIAEHKKRIEEETQRKLKAEQERIEAEKQRIEAQKHSDEIAKQKQFVGNSDEMELVPLYEKTATESKPNQEKSYLSKESKILIDARNSLIESFPALGTETAAKIIIAIHDNKIKHIRLINEQ